MNTFLIQLLSLGRGALKKALLTVFIVYGTMLSTKVFIEFFFKFFCFKFCWVNIEQV